MLLLFLVDVYCLSMLLLVVGVCCCCYCCCWYIVGVFIVGVVLFVVRSVPLAVVGVVVACLCWLLFAAVGLVGCFAAVVVCCLLLLLLLQFVVVGALPVLLLLLFSVCFLFCAVGGCRCCRCVFVLAGVRNCWC